MATRADAIAHVREHLHSGAFLTELDRRVGYRTESQNPGTRRGAARLSGGGPAAGLRRARFHHAPDRIADRQGPVSAGGLSRGCFAADRAHLWPWRRRRRHGRRMARQSRSVADHDQRRSRLWPRHRRQQRPAQHQYGGVARGARGPRRQARLQRQVHHRDRRGDRLAGSAAGLRSPCARSSRPICSWPPTGRGCRRIGRPSSSAAAAASASISTSICAKAAIIPAIGAACSPTPRRSFATPSRASSTARGG